MNVTKRVDVEFKLDFCDLCKALREEILDNCISLTGTVDLTGKEAESFRALWSILKVFGTEFECMETLELYK